MAFAGSRLLNRHEERRSHARTVYLVELPALRETLATVLASPTDLRAAERLREAAENLARLTLFVPGWADGMAAQIHTDALDYALMLSLAARGQITTMGQLRAPTLEEEAEASAWHLHQIDNCLDDLESEVAHVLAPSRHPKRVVRRLQVRLSRKRYSMRWHRDFRKRMRAQRRSRRAAPPA